jgi:hypothetical protein
MANFFDKVLTDIDNLETELLGPDYNYVKYIKTPDELGMTSDGNMDSLASDIHGLISYVEVLATGQSDASKVLDGDGKGMPLGDKFFLQTGAKCNDIATNQQVTRSLYINNVPDGSIPFLTSATGMDIDLSIAKGLVPGIITNLTNINPIQIFQAFRSGSLPDCQLITMDTVDANNNKDTQSFYVTNVDIQNMNACWFTNNGNTNPVSNRGCKEEFKNRNDKTATQSHMPDDPYVKLYYSALAVLGLYILLRIFNRKG